MAALRPDQLVTSDLARAMETAEIVGAATGLEPTADAAAARTRPGSLGGLTRDEVAEAFPDEFADWVAGRDVSRRGGESREQVAARALTAFAELPVVPVTVLVSHSATAMALTNALLGIEQRVHPLGPLANCHWTELYCELGGDVPAWRLRGHNLGAPGTVVPVPAHVGPLDDAADADA